MSFPFTMVEYALYVRTFFLCLMAYLLLAAAGAPLLATLFEMTGRSRKKIFFDKLAKQIGEMGLVMTLGVAPFLVGGWAVLAMRYVQYRTLESATPMLGPAGFAVAGVAALTALFLLQYVMGWKRMKQVKSAHILLGWLTVLSTVATAFLALVLQWIMRHYPTASAVDRSIASFFSAIGSIEPLSSVWPMLTLTVCLGVTACAALGLGWLLARRRKQDFGRDYYAFAYRKTAQAAMWAGLVSVAPMVWLGVTHAGRLGVFDVRQPAWLAYTIGVTCLLLASLAWRGIAHSETPLRLKPAALLAGVLLFAVLVCLGVVAAQLYTLF